jgi:hypothetical protein
MGPICSRSFWVASGVAGMLSTKQKPNSRYRHHDQYRSRHEDVSILTTLANKAAMPLFRWTQSHSTVGGSELISESQCVVLQYCENLNTYMDARTDLLRYAPTQLEISIVVSIVDELFRKDAGMAIGDCAGQLCSLHAAFCSDSQVTLNVVFSSSSVWCSTTLVTLPASAFFPLVSHGRIQLDEFVYLEHVDLSLCSLCISTFGASAVIPASLSVCSLDLLFSLGAGLEHT